MAKIEVSSLNLDYPIVGMGNRSLKNQMLSAMTGGLFSKSAGMPIIRALDNVDFTLGDGERIGLIGHNGAGKSTLLKVLAGIYRPSSGRVQVQGKVVSTLNLSIGMESEATGVENIITRGLLLGMTRREINARLDEIAEFTELGEYLQMPVRVYSAGMVTRLAFATVTAMDADILVMDELIGTGDAAFMERVQQRLKSFMSRSKILVLASHSDDTIRRFCSRAILLQHGRMLGIGPVEDMLERYHHSVQAGVAA